MYQSLYRKYRPKSFSEVVGQDHIVRTLKNQIKLGRIGHAYLFTGTRGTGKTSVAKIFAKAVNCLNPKDGEPCNSCEVCQAINTGSTMDVLEIDAASNNSVNDVRELRESVIYSPSLTKYKVYIIDEVHMLSTGAFNALLKTLEEPPQHVIFILATTEPEKLPDTILSRCQRFDFKKIPTKQIVENLGRICKDSGIQIEYNGIKAIALYGNGSMRDAISLLEQSASYKEGLITYEDVCEILGIANQEMLFSLLDSLYEKDALASLINLDKILSYGIDLGNFLRSFTYLLRDMVIYKTGGDDLSDIIYGDYDTIKEKSQKYTLEFLTNALERFTSLQREIRYAVSPVTLLELTILKMIKPEISHDMASLIARIENLEKKMYKGDEIKGKKEVAVTTEEKVSEKTENGAGISEMQEKSLDLKKVWPEVKGVVKKDRMILFTFLEKGSPKWESGKIVIEYSEEEALLVEELKKPENKSLIDNAVEKVVGKKIPVEFVVKKKEEDLLIDQVKKIFGEGIDIEVI
ncbi:DNA polymerase III subunit gamma/tau [Caldanaerobacter sp.]|uniref:DNA polymerase III subunit gamma/tau n=1 Tax=Caldanaerobacter sp. TaxID=2930036 RepID=UPI003C706BC6